MTHAAHRTDSGQSARDNSKIDYPQTRKERKLRVVPVESRSSIVVDNNPYHQPSSWFLTSDSGELQLSGRLASEVLVINLQGLKSGLYHFRTQGEIYPINVA